jgi:hypothetical protein
MEYLYNRILYNHKEEVAMLYIYIYIYIYIYCFGTISYMYFFK